MRTKLTAILVSALIGACSPNLQNNTTPSAVEGESEGRSEAAREANRAALEELRRRAENAPEPPPAAVPPPVIVLAPDGIEALTDTGDLKGSVVDAFLEGGPHGILGAVSVEPARQSTDGVSGFRVTGFSPEGDFVQTGGVQVDDVITAVNGQSIVMPENFMAVWNGMAEADTLRVELRRGDEDVALEWAIDRTQ